MRLTSRITAAGILKSDGKGIPERLEASFSQPPAASSRQAQWPLHFTPASRGFALRMPRQMPCREPSSVASLFGLNQSLVISPSSCSGLAEPRSHERGQPVPDLEIVEVGVSKGSLGANRVPGELLDQAPRLNPRPRPFYRRPTPVDPSGIGDRGSRDIESPRIPESSAGNGQGRRPGADAEARSPLEGGDNRESVWQQGVESVTLRPTMSLRKEVIRTGSPDSSANARGATRVARDSAILPWLS